MTLYYDIRGRRHPGCSSHATRISRWKLYGVHSLRYLWLHFHYIRKYLISINPLRHWTAIHCYYQLSDTPGIYYFWKSVMAAKLPAQFWILLFAAGIRAFKWSRVSFFFFFFILFPPQSRIMEKNCTAENFVLKHTWRHKIVTEDGRCANCFAGANETTLGAGQGPIKLG